MRLQRNVEDWERMASLAVGVGLVVMAVKRRRPFGALSQTGLALVARGTSGFCPVNAVTGRTRRSDDTREALGGSGGILVQERISIARPREEVFDFWNDPTNLPRFMGYLERVDVLGHGRTHWVMQGPAGVHVEWDAEVINTVEPELIAWRTLSGADVVSAGSVHFRARRGRSTDVTVRMQYDPPGGKAGAAAAWLVGRSPAADLREDLRSLKRILETGGVHAVEGQLPGESAAHSVQNRAHA